MSALTPEKLAELRRLLDANEVPWSAHRPSPNYARYEIRDDRGYDLAYTVEDALGGNAEIIVAAVNALPGLLDAAAERDAVAVDADKWQRAALTLQRDRDALTDERDSLSWQVEALRAERDARSSERDALTAKVERVRELHRPDPSGDWCDCCWTGPDSHGNGNSPEWPCPTIRILDGGAES